MTVPEPFPSWDDVIAECEATAAHAEALLRSRTHEPIRAMPPGRSLAELTANLGQPSREVIARAKALQDRHLRLQAELAGAMRDIGHQSQLSSDGNANTSATPLYIDRRV
jgi:hypothetical protein